jgi:hypothetical protein
VPSKKQRRRQQKLRRHEWEEVYLDEEGNEVEPPPELVERASGRPDKQAGKRAVTPRGVQPPSWRRVLKRGALFAPLMFVMITILEPDSSTVEKLIFTAQLALIFIPFSYFIDVMSYRVWRKRMARDGQPAAKNR